MSSGVDKQLPVFVFPSSVTFYSDDQSTYKQILTLYNPYDFNLRFKVLSTAPHKYSVVDSDGVIKSRCCVDVVIRHNEVITVNEGVRDKFRIQVSDSNSRKTLGCKDLVATLLARKETFKEERFESLPEMRMNPPPVQQNISPAAMSSSPLMNTSRASYVILLAAVLCVAALLLPDQFDESVLPSYLRVSLNMKLVAAYVLGLVTMVLLKA